MNVENQISYYAVIPATVRYDNRLKSAEKLLYGEVTALANKNGFCYAKNRYFANLYNVSIETISRWFSNLQKYGYIKIEIIKNENKEIISRNIYISDAPYSQKEQYPYSQKNQYPYPQKDQEGIDEKVKENNIKYNIDDLFYIIINNSNKIPADFYQILNQLEFIYTKEMLELMKEEKVQMIKNIIYTIYELYNIGFNNIISKFNREALINLYMIAQEYEPNNLLNYYKKAIINNYTNNTSYNVSYNTS